MPRRNNRCLTDHGVAKILIERSMGPGCVSRCYNSKPTDFASPADIYKWRHSLNKPGNKTGMHPLAASRFMYEGRGRIFDLKLVESFIQCLGIYPVGTLVETNKGDVGAIVSINMQQKLKPIVMLILDKNNNKYNPLKILNLYQLNLHGADISIKRILDPGSHGIDVADYVKEIINIR